MHVYTFCFNRPNIKDKRHKAKHYTNQGQGKQEVDHRIGTDKSRDKNDFYKTYRRFLYRHFVTGTSLNKLKDITDNQLNRDDIIQLHYGQGVQQHVTQSVNDVLVRDGAQKVIFTDQAGLGDREPVSFSGSNVSY